MGLLQDPVASLEQAGWYLENKHLEKFPGAFELAAGNLCRQTLEQVLFILCFYSTMPTDNYLRKRDRTLHVAGHLLIQLKKTETDSNKTYLEIARNRGDRIRKFARKPRTLDKWLRVLNEPSHFSIKFRKTDEHLLMKFINLAKTWFDNKDKHLIVCALNEIFSRGRVWATLRNDPDNTPEICQQVVVSANNLERTQDGGLALRGPKKPCLVISSTEIPRGRWPRVPVVVQHSVGISFVMEFVNKHKKPINISSMTGLIESFSSTVGEKRYLSQCLRKLGIKITYQSDV